MALTDHIADVGISFLWKVIESILVDKNDQHWDHETI
jgi:hypothetical protein